MKMRSMIYKLEVAKLECFSVVEWVLQYIRESIPEVGSQKSCFEFVCT
jgi:hypothetical protein